MSELAAGTTIGRYIVRGQLGRGGMGIVYEAHDPELDRTIAIKLLAPALHASSSSVQARTRLLREAQAMARLSHPNVIAVHDVGTFGEQVFVAMERIDGVTLTAWLSKRPRSLQEVLAVFRQAGAGLSAAHAAGLIHRDFKPDNVLIDREGRPRVLDFGLARSADLLLDQSSPGTWEGDPAVLGLAETVEAGATEAEEASRKGQSPGLLASPLTATGTLLGTPLYMSPEQHRREPIDARSDQFSFCVALYEALCGERPFQGSTLLALSLATAEGKIDLPKGARVPEHVRKAVLRGLRPRPSDRFASMEALLAELTPDRSPSRRAFVAGGVAAVVLATGGVLTLLRRRLPAAAPPTYRQLTFTGQSSTPRFSPDGRRLAYLSGNEIRVRDLPSGADRVVREAPDVTTWFHWFSSSELAFLQTTDLLLVSVDRESTRRIPAESSRAPDGSKALAFGQSSRSITIVNTINEERSTLEIPGDFSWLEDASWAPSGDSLLLRTSQSGKYSISTIPLNGAAQIKLLTDVDAGPPCWSPRGDSFYYLRGRNELIKVPLASHPISAAGPPETLLSGLDADEDIGVSPDGRTLVYTRGGPRAGLWRANAEAQGATLLDAAAGKGGSTQSGVEKLSARVANRSALSVSPDGARIAFAQTQASANLFTLALDGGAQRQVTTSTDFAQIWATAWSPDGREIVCTAALRDGNVSLYRVSIDTGIPTLIHQTVSMNVAWAPGRQIVIQTIGNQNFGVLDPGTGTMRPLRASNEGWAFTPFFSPDGETVALFINGRKRGICLVSVADGTSRLLAEGELKPAGFSRDGATLYAKSGVSGKDLVAIAIGTGAVTPLATLPFENGANTVVNVPGTTRFACLVDESNSDIWAVDGFDPASAL
ncbi:MAG: WD40 repeat domain-containing serine/threonine protein kinase [Byssovorax sp.]